MPEDNRMSIDKGRPAPLRAPSPTLVLSCVISHSTSLYDDCDAHNIGTPEIVPCVRPFRRPGMTAAFRD